MPARITKSQEKLLERCFDNDDWKRAERILRAVLGAEPNSHWIVSRLSTVYYEQRQYRRALKWSERAYAMAPECPMVLWDLACGLDAVGDKQESIDIWNRLIRRGVQAIALGPCGEGVVAARKLIADCQYRVALAHGDLGRLGLAARHMKHHIKLRAEGARSIYHLRDARAQLQQIEARREKKPKEGAAGSKQEN